jgi:hypothetical protein
MKVIKTEVSKSKISSTIDPFEGLDVSALTPAEKESLLEEIGQTLVDSVLQSLASSKTPISGGGYKSFLSPAYAAFKREYGAGSSANLDLTGSMLDSLSFKAKGDVIEIGVFGSEAPKADGHNNFSGDSKLPQRQFLPKEGQRFKRDIDGVVKSIIKDSIYTREKITRAELSSVMTKKDFWGFLESKYPGLTRKDIRFMVTTDPDMLKIMTDGDMLEWL